MSSQCEMMSAVSLRFDLTFSKTLCEMRSVSPMVADDDADDGELTDWRLR